MDDKSKCRGEPVYQVNMKGNGWEDCSFARYESAGRVIAQDAEKGWKRWKRRVLWTGPQPAEPVNDMRLETPAENIARDMREGRFPNKSEPQMVSAEPVKGPSDVMTALAHALTALEPYEGTVPGMVSNEIRDILARYGQPAQPAGVSSEEGQWAVRLISKLIEIIPISDTLKATRDDQAIIDYFTQLTKMAQVENSEKPRIIYTYKYQPGNLGAWRMGKAWEAASMLSAGDYIDRGLGLLKSLQEEGYGIVSLDPKRNEY